VGEIVTTMTTANDIDQTCQVYGQWLPTIVPLFTKLFTIMWV